jgi:Acyl-CoA dehydrogenase, N-terminal domain
LAVVDSSGRDVGSHPGANQRRQTMTYIIVSKAGKQASKNSDGTGLVPSWQTSNEATAELPMPAFRGHDDEPDFWTAQPNAANVPHDCLSLAPAPMIPNAPRPFDFDLGDSAEMIRESARAFAEKEIAPRASGIDRDNLFPRDLWPKMGALGLHGITAPEEYGGLGHSGQ